MTSKETPKLIGSALQCLSRVIEADTEVTTIDLTLLSNLNTNQSLNYIKLEQHLASLEKDAARLEASKKEYQAIRVLLDEIEKSVDYMEEVVSELDVWSKEKEISSLR